MLHVPSYYIRPDTKLHFLTYCYLRSEIVQIGGYYSQLIADYRLLKLKGLQISFRYYCLQAGMV